MDNIIVEYRTSDTTLSAFLIISQFTLLYIDYSHARFDFAFPLSDEIKAASTHYLSGNALIEPSSFTRIHRKLLRLIRKQCQ